MESASNSTSGMQRVKVWFSTLSWDSPVIILYPLDKFKDLTKIYYKGADVVLIVYDITSMVSSHKISVLIGCRLHLKAQRIGTAIWNLAMIWIPWFFWSETNATWKARERSPAAYGLAPGMDRLRSLVNMQHPKEFNSLKLPHWQEQTSKKSRTTSVCVLCSVFHSPVNKKSNYDNINKEDYLQACELQIQILHLTSSLSVYLRIEKTRA